MHRTLALKHVEGFAEAHPHGSSCGKAWPLRSACRLPQIAESASTVVDRSQSWLGNKPEIPTSQGRHKHSRHGCIVVSRSLSPGCWRIDGPPQYSFFHTTFPPPHPTTQVPRPIQQCFVRPTHANKLSTSTKSARGSVEANVPDEYKQYLREAPRTGFCGSFLHRKSWRSVSRRPLHRDG